MQTTRRLTSRLSKGNLMAITHVLTSLSNSAAIILEPAPTDITVNLETYPTWNSFSMSIQNVHASAVVYLGGPDVTSSSYGVKLVPGAVISFDFFNKDTNLYAISDTNNSQVGLLIVRR
jgi:hypothetical protein